MPRRRQGAESKMDMTPMIDCVFLLIIFFVIVTQVVTDRVPLEPPTADEANEDPIPKGFATVNVDRDGIVYVGAARASNWQDFRIMLEAKKKEHAAAYGQEDYGQLKLSKLDLYIRGDLVSQWKLVQEVVATAQDIGIYRTEYGAVVPQK